MMSPVTSTSVATNGADALAGSKLNRRSTKGSIEPDEDGRRLSVPVAAAEGLTTRVVRALDNAGVQVNDVTMRRASLDDVFGSLTGHATGAGDDREGREAA